MNGGVWSECLWISYINKKGSLMACYQKYMFSPHILYVKVSYSFELYLSSFLRKALQFLCRAIMICHTVSTTKLNSFWTRRDIGTRVAILSSILFFNIVTADRSIKVICQNCKSHIIHHHLFAFQKAIRMFNNYIALIDKALQKPV